MTLDEIGRKHGTDKSSLFHDYLRWYERLLPPKPQHLLEIGVQEGASLRMWREFYQCEVYGVDRQPCPLDVAGIHVFQGDQTDAEFLRSVCREITPHRFDVIVDDASHLASATLTTFHALWPELAPGGMYVMEDTCCSYWPEFVDARPTPLEFCRSLVDRVHWHGFRPTERGQPVNARSRDILGRFVDQRRLAELDVELLVFLNGAVLLQKTR